jgi:hypothetical protein
MFTQSLDLFNPDIWIECRDLKSSSQIYRIMKRNNVTHYAYVICYKKNVYAYEIFKVGQSAPSGSRKNIKEMGERISRQLGHLPGWAVKQASSHGYDLMLSIERNLLEGKFTPKTTAQQMHKNDWAVGIWDLKKYGCFAVASNEAQAQWAEAELANQYKQFNNGNLPMGNIVDPTNNSVYKKGYVHKKTFDDFFNVIDNNSILNYNVKSTNLITV